MVVFIQILRNNERSVSLVRRLWVWEYADVSIYFPNYERVIADYCPFPHPARDIFFYWGRMEHFRAGGDRSRPDVVASFLAWHCVECQIMHHSFNEIDIWNPDTASYSHQCCTHLTELDDSYDPDSPTPHIITCLAPGFRQIRSFVRDCHRCRRRYWKFVDEYRLNSHGRAIAGPFCHPDPLNAAAPF